MNSSLVPSGLAPCVLFIGLSACASAPTPAPSPTAGAKPEIEALVFQIEIAAPVEKVWDTMLGPEGYSQWTKPFHPGSYFEHLGYVLNGVEDTTSDAVRSWAPAHETYRFASVPGGTLLTVQHEVLVGSEDYMNQTWPEALAALESLCVDD